MQPKPAHMSARQKDYLGHENARNTKNAQLYTDIINAAFGRKDVIIGHHLTFEQHGEIKTENEIPAADTLLFDMDVAVRLFGAEEARKLLTTIATMPVTVRDAWYARAFYAKYHGTAVVP